jgi:hypothetical protein
MLVVHPCIHLYVHIHSSLVMFVFHCGSCQFQGLLEWQGHPEEVAGQYGAPLQLAG